jgi:hypothetical protein
MMYSSQTRWDQRRYTGYISGTDALRQLMRSQDNGACIVKISPKGNTLTNGVQYCYVGIKCKDGTDYSVQAYGKEAIELHEEATMITTRPMMPVFATI